MTYTTRWIQTWAVLAAAAVGFASLQWSPLVVVLAVLASTASAATVLVMQHNLRTPAATGLASLPVRQLGQRALLAGCCVVAMSTLLAASPVLALLVVVLVAVTSPVVVRRPRCPTPPQDTRPCPAPPATTGVSALPGERPDRPTPADRPVEALDDEDLFKLWRRTFWELDTQPSVEEVAWLVALRQSCLDELGRRNPVALQAWLSSNARASSGPERFWAAEPDRGDAHPDE